MPGRCLSKGVIYGATVTQTDSGKTETCTGLCEPTFKSRYGGHLSTFKHENANHTTLSKHVWDLKRAKTPPHCGLDYFGKEQSFQPHQRPLQTLHKGKILHYVQTQNSHPECKDRILQQLHA